MTQGEFPFDPDEQNEQNADEQTIQARFERFHAEHPEVYRELVKLARQAQRSGRKHYGIRTIWEVMRWNFSMRGDPFEEFKLNDHYHSRYARLIARQEPDLADLFEFRALHS